MHAVRRGLTVAVVLGTVSLGARRLLERLGLAQSDDHDHGDRDADGHLLAHRHGIADGVADRHRLSPSPTGSPSTVTPSPTGSVLGITVAYAPTSAAKDQRVDIVGTTDPSLAGKPVWIVKTNDGAPKVLGTGSNVNAKGVAKSYVQLLRTGVLKLVVPAGLLTAGPYDPGDPGARRVGAVHHHHRLTATATQRRPLGAPPGSRAEVRPG